MDSRLIVGAPLVFIVAVLQNTAFFSIGGIKVNIIMIVLTAYLFIALTFFDYCFLLLSAVAGLMSPAGWDVPILAFITALFVAYGARRFMPFQPWFGYYAVLGMNLLILYGIIDWHFIFNTPVLFFQELFYTMIGGAFLYAFAVRYYAQRPRYTF